MKYVPKSITRFGGRSLLKLNGHSPTILVVAGVVGLGATAVMAAKATRHVQPILDDHEKGRATIDETVYISKRAEQKALLHLYTDTSMELTKLYGPTLVVGTMSTLSVLGGHRILKGRHVATMAAYTGLAEQFTAYRARVSKTLGKELEKSIFEGAHGEYVEDPNHKGEFSLQSKFDPNALPASYLRPMFDEANDNWTRHAEANLAFLTGVQSHMNTLLNIRGHVLLNDVLDQLKMPRCAEGAIAGWLRDNPVGDQYVDFGFMTSSDPLVIAFNEGRQRSVRLNFNIDPGPIYDKI